MKIKYNIVALLIGFLSISSIQAQDLNPAQQPHLIGYWKFQDKNNLTQKTVGSNLVLTGNHTWVAGPAVGDTAIRIAVGSYYTFTHGIKPNGGGTRVNQYTLMYDFKVLNFNKWHTFHQIDSTNKNDGECFIRPITGTAPGRIGVAATSYSQDSINPNQWYRLMISVNNGHFYRYYLNGELILEGDTQDLDQRFSLGTQILFFADDNQEDDTIDIASVAMFDTCLSTAEIAAIGTIEPCIANPPKPQLGNDTMLCSGQSIMKNAGSGFIKYNWSTGGKTQLTPLDLNKLKMGKNTVWVQVTDANNCVGSDTMIVTFSPTPSVNLGKDTAVCKGNSITLKAGTDTSYTYVWKYLPKGNTLSNLSQITTDSSGIYFAQATSKAGCIGKDSLVFKVNANPTKPSITANGKTTFCEGGSVQLTGPLGYAKYYWKNALGMQNLDVTNSDTIALHVEDYNGCKSPLSDATITTMNPNPKPIILNNYKDTHFCNNSVLVIQLPTGYAGYLWQDGNKSVKRTISVVGSYSVKVTDAKGCTSVSSNTILVDERIAPTGPFLNPSGTANFCAGDSIVLHGPDGFEKYLWSDSSTNKTLTVKVPGDYQLKVMNQTDCYSIWSTPTTIIETPLPAKPSIVAQGKDSLKCATVETKYTWTYNNIYLDTNRTIAAKNTGVYRVRIFDGMCWSPYSDSFQFQVNATLKLQRPAVVVYPNPAKGHIAINLPPGDNSEVKVILFDAAGKQVLVREFRGSSLVEGFQLGLGDLKSGTYRLYVQNRSQTAMTNLVLE